MVRITCDNCGAGKPEKLPATAEWILGYDLETETPKSVRRSIRLLDRAIFCVFPFVCPLHLI